MNPSGTTFRNSPWVWVVAAFLAASARLFEEGLSLDSVLYATVARNFAESGNWWSLSFGKTLFPQFFEQPFPLFWLNGLVFRAFGATDYTARWVGLVFGSLTFFYLFRLADYLGKRAFAHVYCFICLLDANFVGRFATPFLEIPLTFFCFATLFHSLEWIDRPGASLRSAIKSGLFLAGAALTKGFAALPILGTVGLLAIFARRFALPLKRDPWVFVGVATLGIALFCVPQAIYGDYSFAHSYYQSTFLERTLGLGAGIGPAPFLNRLLSYAGIPIFLTVLSVWKASRNRSGGRPLAVGLVGGGMFVTANAFLGLPFLHYYHGILPFLNLSASVVVADWLKRWNGKEWGKWALCLGLAVQVFWNIVPKHMRRRAPEDFFQLRPMVVALSDSGERDLDALGISDSDWIYRQFSRWYWRADSRLVGDWSGVKSEVVVAAAGYPEPREGLGFRRCIGSNRYDIWVRGDRLHSLCRHPFATPR